MTQYTRGRDGKRNVPIEETVRYTPEEVSAISREPLGQPAGEKAVNAVFEDLVEWWNLLVTDCISLCVDAIGQYAMDDGTVQRYVDWTDEAFGEDWTTNVRAEAEPDGAIVFHMTHVPPSGEEEGAG